MAQRPTWKETKPLHYSPEFIEAIALKRTICDALKACKTDAEVAACAKKYAAEYKQLMEGKDTAIFALHVKNLADHLRDPVPEVRFDDAALEAATKVWPAIARDLKHSETKFERVFSARVLKKLGDPEWSPSVKEARVIKSMHRDWQSVPTGSVLE